MDAVQSGSSLGSIPTIATQSIGITMPMHNQPLYNGREYIDEVGEGVLEDKDSHEDDDDGEADDEEEGREDSLTYTQFYQHQVTDEVVEATPLRSSSHSPSPDTLSGAPQGPQQNLTTHPPAFSAGLDPRMVIDYERRYIVDLERINEEATNASRSGFSGGNPSTIPSAEDGANNKMQSQNQVQQHQQNQQQLHQQRQQHLGQFQATTAQAINLHQQQQYHPLAPAPAPHPQQQQQQPNNQFYNYRHQYYQEQYLDDNETALTSKYDDDTNSTCSSVTLSQAFQPSDVDSCSSYDGLNSTVSSITFSQVDQHEHVQQGYYIATKLGDFVHKVPNEVDVHDDEQTYGDGDTTVQEPENANNLKTPEDEKDAPTANDTTTTHATTTAAAEGDLDESEKNDKQVGTTTEDMAADLIAAIVPECGVPIPSVMAKVGSTRRRKSSNTGLLLPWHSSRSIQNYHRKKGGKQQQQPANNSLFSISSVHTFRG
jgi:hypothetical protein